MGNNLENTKIQWHSGFYGAAELEFGSDKEVLEFNREYNLSKEPLRMDLLIIKKVANVPIKNEIGRMFRTYNVVEYKSPDDSLSISDYYKTVAYACLYKAETEGTEEIFDADTTVSVVREEKPVKLLKQLRERYEVTQKADGIYRINGMIFPMQILVTKELDKEAHIWVTSLTRTLNREQAQELLVSCAGLNNEGDKRNADSVVNVASEANIKLFRKMIQEGDQMCEELKELLAPEIVEFKIRLAEQDAELADKDAKLADNAAKLADNAAEIAKLKKLLAQAGIQL